MGGNMMKKKFFVGSIYKQITALLLCFALLAGPLATSASAAQEAVAVTAQLCPQFTIVIDGTTQNFYNAQGQEVYPLVYNGVTYLAFIPAEISIEEDAEVVIMQIVEENGEELLEAVEDDEIADAVFDIVMERAEAEEE